MRSRDPSRPRSLSATFVVLGIGLIALASSGPSHGQAIPTIDGERAMEHLRAQCDFGPRVPGTEAHRLTRDYLVAELTPYAHRVEVQSFRASAGGESLRLFNIGASFSDDPEGGYLLCAHWDTRPTADKDPNPANRRLPIPGANDGASGVAVLLEVARLLYAVPAPVPVAIAFFDGEDYGATVDGMFLGSRHYATSPIFGKPKYAILLDMVGDADLDLPIEPISWKAAPDLIRGVWDTAASMGVRSFNWGMSRPVYDDHVPLIASGIAAIAIIDLDYAYWHTLADTPDKCSPGSLEQVGNVILRFLLTRGT